MYVAISISVIDDRSAIHFQLLKVAIWGFGQIRFVSIKGQSNETFFPTSSGKNEC
jgi:hypothetical protein